MPFRDLPGVIQCRFKRGQKLIKAGDTVDYVYYIIQGTVHREIVTDNGYEHLMSRKSGSNVIKSIVGILLLYEHRERPVVSGSDFIAYTNCLCYKIPVTEFQKYLRNHPDLLEEVVYLAMEEYTGALERLHMRREGNASSKLCAILLERAKETEIGPVVPRKCTNVELSKLLSVHKVTVAKMIRELKLQDAVERTEYGLWLKDPALLKEYADGTLRLEYE